MTQLTKHFALSEFTVSETAARRGWDNTPKGKELQNLHRLAEVMERVRAVLDEKPILITSGYRSSVLNMAVGGSQGSRHTHGLACDFTCPGYGSPLKICKTLEPIMGELGIDQLIHEFNTWVHLGLRDGPPRHQALTIDAKGTRSGF